MHHLRAPDTRSHRRNRSVSAAPAPTTLRQQQQQQQQQQQSHNVLSPNDNVLLVPSRQAPSPPTTAKRMQSSSSTPAMQQLRQPSRQDQFKYFPSYGRSDQTLPIRGQTMSSPDSHMGHSRDELHMKKGNQRGNISGFGKLLKRLQSKASDDDLTRRTNNRMKQQQHSNSGLSTPSLPSATYEKHEPPIRNPHNIPLAPPAPPPPQIPSIEIGKKTYLQPELRAGLQESDDLLSKMPAELRTRPNFNKAQQPQQQPQATHPPLASSYNNQQQPNNVSTATHYQQSNPPPRSILINSQEHLTRSSNTSDSTMPAYPIANDIYNYYGHHINNTPPQHQQRQEEVHNHSSLRPINDEEKDDDESSNRTQRHSTWSYASTGKSSGTYSLYSTFGTDSRPTSESVLDLDTTSDKEESKEQPSSPPEQQVDLAQIVCNNVRGKSPARIITTNEDEEEDGSSSDSDEDVFVDATGMSQEDLEREKLNGKRISKRLSKRLSGGHFGSAGGLLLSINAPPPVPSLPSNLPNDNSESTSNNTQTASQVIERNTPSPSIASSVAPDTPPQSSSPEISLSKTANAMGISAETASEKVELGTCLSPPPPRRPMNQRRKRSFHGQQVAIDNEPNQAKDTTVLPEIRLDQQQSQPRDSEARFASQKIWNGDESFVTKERAAEWLGQGKPLNARALEYYMDNFDFKTMRIDSAFRKLCSKLYFKAEAQQIDRILEAFARRFWHCNPQCIFGNIDIVYAVAYSLLLLNTDLHVAQGNHARMTRQAFVRNTMSTIEDQLRMLPPEKRRGHLFTKTWEADMEICLKELYGSVKQNQILQPLESQQQQLTVNTSDGVEKRNSILMGGRRVAEFKRSVNTMIRKSGRESVIYPEEPIPRASTSADQPTSSMVSPRRASFSSSTSGNSSTINGNARSPSSTLSPNQPMMSFMHSHGSDLFTSRPPYLKEGMLARKHLLENANQKAKHREWKDCFLVVGSGEFKMYSMQGSVGEERRSLLRMSSVNTFATLADSLNRSATSSPNSMLGGRWASTMQLLGNINLNHSLSNILPPPGYNRQRPHVFAIQQSNGGVFLFQTASQDQAKEWVETCNYWAARLSKEPLPGGVSNMEYGWGSCLDDVILNLDADDGSGKYFGNPDTVNVYEWKPPAPPTVSSTLNEEDQFAALQKHLDALSTEINEHRELKRKILVKFSTKTHNHPKVMSNWEAKSNYLLHEIIKYQNYCDALERSVQRRQELQSKEREEQENQHKEQNSMEPLDYKESKLDLFSEIGREIEHLSVK
ncbi:hypothetical protein K492DRAFT_171645 [Lichtheimia hyalospora FSU 10163]|nr:hypothetical protein K492DRAFT_171645 [Lichtheimia hyalospora FSU 10163]